MKPYMKPATRVPGVLKEKKEDVRQPFPEQRVTKSYPYS
jgi:hypothetical protein